VSAGLLEDLQSLRRPNGHPGRRQRLETSSIGIIALRCGWTVGQIGFQEGPEMKLRRGSSREEQGLTLKTEPAPQDPLQLRGDFDRATLPWMDAALATVDEYVESLGDQVPAGSDLRELLLSWLQFGYVVLPGAIEHRLIDAYLEDIGELFDGREGPTMLTLDPLGLRAINTLTADDLNTPALRVMDFHNQSIAGKKLALHPSIVSFLSHVFRQTIVCMQTLTFIHGTQQAAHQDYAFVVSGIPSHLAAVWIALEDIHPDAGPLGYYPGSHSIRKFDFGDGLFLTPDSPRREPEFLEHIERRCQERGLHEEVFLARKGDVFIWHSALAHSGTPVKDPSRTRRSLVAHYSTKSAYRVDRRAPDAPVVEHSYNGGIVFADPLRPEAEDSFPRGASIEPD
jgi:phytanoyl-CoA hydroxylase